MRLEWDKAGEKLYETGVRNGVLYPVQTGGVYSVGYAWNGLTSVTESPSGAEPTALYADDIKYLNLVSAEEFGGTIEAYMFPDEWYECDGSASLVDGVYAGQQSRKTFGLSFRTVLGNDELNNEYGYKLHLIYGALASPSERAYQTVNDSPEAQTLSWEFTTTPVNVSGMKPTSCVTINSKVADEDCIKVLEAYLYGTDDFDESKAYAVGDLVAYGTTDANKKLYKFKAIHAAGTWSADDVDELGTAGPRLPLPDEVKSIMTPSSALG